MQISVALLLSVSLEGFAIAYFASPPLALSAHKLGGLQSALLMALGLIWPRLRLGTAGLRWAFWLLLYGAFAILAAYVLGALWGAGNETMPLAAGDAHGSAVRENVIRIIAYSSGPTGIVSFALVLWGLRVVERDAELE